MIKAECWSDDKCIEVKFDATEWFKQAKDKHIIELAKCGWRGDYPSDNVAYFMADMNKDIQRMFDYINIRDQVIDCGFECSVNEDDAMNWLTINRPNVAEKIELTNKE
jgi:hypothetical protein